MPKYFCSIRPTSFGCEGVLQLEQAKAAHARIAAYRTAGLPPGTVRIVAQICNLPYRRVALGWAFDFSGALGICND
jgi:hypothetical protein